MIKKVSKYLKENKVIENELGTFEIQKDDIPDGGTSLIRVAKKDENDYVIKFLLENQKEESTAYKRFKQAHNITSNLKLNSILTQLHLTSLVLDKETVIPYIVMPRAKGTLKDFKKNNKITFEIFELIFNRMMELLKDIHNHKIIHRDLKPENIFLLTEDIDSMVLGDFDIAKFDDELYEKLHKTKDKERLANYLFSAPEQKEKSKEFEEITYSADLYAFGQILYWLLKDETLQGQAKINFIEIDNRLKNYEAVIEQLLQNDSSKRFQDINEIEYFMKDGDKIAREAIKLVEDFKTIVNFDKILNKYSYGLNHHSYKKIDDKKIINEILSDFSASLKELDLAWTQGMQYNNIPYISKYKPILLRDKIKEKIPWIILTIWIISDFEMDIKSVWIFKYNGVGGSILILETNPMKSLGIFKNKYDEEEVALFQNKYIPKSHADDGWTKINGKKVKVKDYEVRSRNLQKDIFFIAPFSGSIIGNNNVLDAKSSDEIINKIYQSFIDKREVSEDLLAPLKKIGRKPSINYT